MSHNLSAGWASITKQDEAEARIQDQPGVCVCRSEKSLWHQSLLLPYLKQGLSCPSLCIPGWLACGLLAILLPPVGTYYDYRLVGMQLWIPTQDHRLVQYALDPWVGSPPFHLTFWDRTSQWTWNSLSQLDWLSCVSASPALGWQRCIAMPSFLIWVLGYQTRVFMFAQEALYWRSQAPLRSYNSNSLPPTFSCT